MSDEEPHVQLWVAGTDVTCDTLAELTIHGGRSDWMAQPDPATCSFTVEWGPTGLKAPRIGDKVNVAGWLPGRKAGTFKALFTGHITDLSDEDGWVSVVAVDPLRRLQGVFAGDTPWPVETLPQRLDRIWAAAVARVGAEDAAWMGRDSVLNPVTIWPTDGQLRFVIPRDVDHQPALGLWYEYAAPVGLAMYYQPHGVGLATPAHPQDPAQWTPARAVVGVLAPAYQGQGGVVDACLILGDPPPRRWENLSTVVTEWKTSGVKVDVHTGVPLDPAQEWESVVSAPDARRARYGYRQSSFRTTYADRDWHNANPERPFTQAEYDMVGKWWLDRTNTPTWACDGIVVVFDPGTLDPLTEAQQDAAWRIVGGGPSQCGVTHVLQGITSSKESEWVVENTEIKWTEGGWQVTLGCTDPAVYAGTVADQAALLLVAPPTSSWLEGTTVDVEVYDPTDGTPITTGTLRFGINGPVTQVAGARTTLPTGALPFKLTPEVQSFEIQYLPPQGSPLHAASTTLTLFVQNINTPVQDRHSWATLAIPPRLPGSVAGTTVDVTVTRNLVDLATGQTQTQVPVTAGTLTLTVAGVAQPPVPITGATTKVPTGPLRPGTGVTMSVLFTPAAGADLDPDTDTRTLDVQDVPSIIVPYQPARIPLAGTTLQVQVVDALGQPITTGWLRPAHSNAPARTPVTGATTDLFTGPLFNGLKTEGVYYFAAGNPGDSGAAADARLFWPITIGADAEEATP